MKKFIIQFILLIAVIVIGFTLYKQNPDISKLPLVPPKAVTKELQINSNKLTIEVADTQTKRNQGMGGRESLASDSGMLFIFPNADKYRFWMKGLSFPLDFVWIKGDTVIDTLENVPPPPANTPDSALQIYQPKDVVDKVLEVNTGVVKRLNIKAGDAIKLNP